MEQLQREARVCEEMDKKRQRTKINESEMKLREMSHQVSDSLSSGKSSRLFSSKF